MQRHLQVMSPVSSVISIVSISNAIKSIVVVSIFTKLKFTKHSQEELT
jgi:hypothetical protein